MSVSLSEVLAKMAAIAQNVGDSGSVTDGEVCRICYLDVGKEDHDPDCGWVIARTLSGSDIAEIRRLARVLAYDGSPKNDAKCWPSTESRPEMGGVPLLGEAEPTGFDTVCFQGDGGIVRVYERVPNMVGDRHQWVTTEPDGSQRGVFWPVVVQQARGRKMIAYNRGVFVRGKTP